MVASRFGDTRLQNIVETYARAWRELGCVRGVSIRRVDYNRSLHLTVGLRDGEDCCYDLTDHELVMGGGAALRYWLDTITSDMQRCAAEEVNQRHHNSQRCNFIFVDEVGETDRLNLDTHRFADWYTGGIWTVKPLNLKAEQRSKELFLKIAGKEAFDLLQANKAFPILGSCGTSYTLHKRATYCVERVSDGAKLCAVVPGVPLWDHLLGIKLLVEHDEPAFLSTAVAFL